MEILPSTIENWKTVVVTPPTAGNEWVATPPSPGGKSKAWILKSVTAAIVQGATQTPQPVLVLDDGTNVWAESVGCTVVQAANTTCTYTWADALVQSGLQGSGSDAHSQAPLPCGSECLIPQGWRVRSHTMGIGGNTQWGNIVLYVCELG